MRKDANREVLTLVNALFMSRKAAMVYSLSLKDSLITLMNVLIDVRADLPLRKP